MNTYSRFLVMLAMVFATASAFVAPTHPCTSVTRSRPATSVQLQQSTIPRESTTDNKESSSVAWIDRPRKSTDDDLLFEVADSTEILLGRVAMVGAVFFLAQEILTGESIPAQLVDLVAGSS